MTVHFGSKENPLWPSTLDQKTVQFRSRRSVSAPPLTSRTVQFHYIRPSTLDLTRIWVLKNMDLPTVRSASILVCRLKAKLFEQLLRVSLFLIGGYLSANKINGIVPDKFIKWHISPEFTFVTVFQFMPFSITF